MLVGEVNDVFIHHEDTDGKVVVCAISRKTPKLLDLLREEKGEIDAIWDKLTILTEIALPFVHWEKVKRVILMDDAIYFGSTFTAVYQQIQKYAPHVRIVPMCCIRASEAELVFDNDLRTTTVPRYTGHYFVNCLSIAFRKMCSPFEVEFPVFRISLPDGCEKISFRLFESFQKSKWNVYPVNNQMSRNWNKKAGIDDCDEFGLDISQDGKECCKFRFYVRKGELLISSICTKPIAETNFFNGDSFSETEYETPWKTIKDSITVSHKSMDVNRSLCVAINFIYSISVFVKRWESVRHRINEAFGIKISNMQLELRKREMNFLFGYSVGDVLSKWYYEEFVQAYRLLLGPQVIKDIDGFGNDKEYLPANLPYRSLYREWQEKFLHKFHTVPELLLSEFYLQNLMLDKKNRMFYAVNNERLKYGHTFGSLAALLSKACMEKESKLLEMHAWVDTHIDAACIVPQYIPVENSVTGKIWLRVFRSGENELPFISHWARLSVAILRKELELTGKDKMDVAFFTGMVSWIYQRFNLADYFLDDAECYYFDGRYSMRVLINWEKVDVLETMEQLAIIKRNRNRNLVEMKVDLLDSELFAGSVLPDVLMDEIEDYLETLNRTILGIDEYQVYIPYFDARLCDSSKCTDEGYVAPEAELLRKAFTLFSNMGKNKGEDSQKSKDVLSTESKALLSQFVTLHTHKKGWYEENCFKKEPILGQVIEMNFATWKKRGFWSLIQIVRLAFFDKKGDTLHAFIQGLKNQNLLFLESFVAGSKGHGINFYAVLRCILQKSYLLWKF